jgi:hypothetical protein
MPLLVSKTTGVGSQRGPWLGSWVWLTWWYSLTTGVLVWHLVLSRRRERLGWVRTLDRGNHWCRCWYGEAGQEGLYLGS